jgi:hypothetical protein
MACQSHFDELLKYIFKLLAFFIGNLSAMFYLDSVASNNGTPTKPNQTTMNQYKATTRVPHISEPFVDWYDAETEEQARTMWSCDRETYGLPVDASVKFEKQ